MGRKVTVVGGGASGMAAAIMAARQGAQVAILEHMDRVGKKLLSTGNGRCNLTNLSLENGCYHCSQPEFPMRVISRFNVERTLGFFEELGIMAKSKNGYIYPNSEQASAVLDMLRLELSRLQIQVVTGCQVKQLRKKNGSSFLAVTNQGDFFGDALILSTGSKAAPVTGSDGSGYRLAEEFGHRIITPLPALVQLCCEGRYFKELAGVRCEAEVSLICAGKLLSKAIGEIQLTDYGISGIPTFQVSRFASVSLARKKPVHVVLDFLPAKSREETETFLKKRVLQMPHLEINDFLTGILHKKLAAVLVKLSHIPAHQTAAEVAQDAWKRLAGQIKSFQAVVLATKSFEHAQVCCGGVDTRGIRPETMESKLVPGLYLTGELLDVDGICGGYNLQWAWSSGCLAGIHAGSRKNVGT